MKIEGLDILSILINAERRIIILEKLLDKALAGNKVTFEDVPVAQDIAIAELQKKYPNLGIEKQPE